MGILEKIFKPVDIEGERTTRQMWVKLNHLEKQKERLANKLYEAEAETYSKPPPQEIN